MSTVSFEITKKEQAEKRTSTKKETSTLLIFCEQH
ncbi:hypothetical protein P343_11825 [Sporolactobacillus laevolacticus DSM 442]|uniref:Uncharacterized protein n=1 Tax=Sporolactobacillus laevolacticus DSM 442 TaxID=1395513 RepID=V6IWC4_9BACL|nr:hypothetical protein P343_11825 [Sporolactobacillus laevolacticus DSM 442]